MAVFRVERTNNYTVMSNHHLRDKSLSLKAKGLLSLMLSLPENWDYTLSGLARICMEGKDAIRAAVVELEKAGYIRRSQTTAKDRKFSSNEYVIREQPASQEASSQEPSSVQPSSAQPLSENPTTGKPATVSTTQINKDSGSKEKQNTDPSRIDPLPVPVLPSAASTPAPAQEEPKRRKRKRERRKVMSQGEMDACRELIRENIDYDGFVREHSYDAGQLDEMVELMMEAVCSKKETLRVAGNDFPQAAVKDRLLKLDREHIRFVFDCLQENTTQVRNMKQYLLTVLFNAPVTIENHYAAQVSHDLYGEGDAV